MKCVLVIDKENNAEDTAIVWAKNEQQAATLTAVEWWQEYILEHADITDVTHKVLSGLRAAQRSES